MNSQNCAGWSWIIVEELENLYSQQMGLKLTIGGTGTEQTNQMLIYG